MKSKKLQYKKAVGLQYDGSDVPKISARGEYLNADLIVKLAKRYNVPVVEDPQLAQALQALDNNQEIPEHLYEAVAVMLHELKKQPD